MWGNIFDALEPIRESGDGDSGTEDKNMSAEGAQNEDYECVKEALLAITKGVEEGEKKPKIRKQHSKIPIRQNRVSCTASAADKSEVVNKSEDAKGCSYGVADAGLSTGDLYFIDEKCESLSGDLNLNGSQDRGSDFGDIFNDLTCLDFNPDESESAQDSLSPRVSLADLCETIIDAPEEFQSSVGETPVRVDDNSLGTPRDSNQYLEESDRCTVFRDHDNSDATETGDTCGRAPDKDKTESGNRGSEISSVSISGERDSKQRDVCKPTPCELTPSPIREVIGAEDYNGGEDCGNNEVTNDWHVGTCKPATPVNLDGVKSGHNARVPSSSVADMQDRAAPHSSEIAEEDKVAIKDRVQPESFLASDACVRAEHRQSSPTVTPSIENGVARCAQASRCSRDLTVPVSAALNSKECHTASSSSCEETSRSDLKTDCGGSGRNVGECCVGDETEGLRDGDGGLANESDERKDALSWEFRNGRLVFDVAARVSKCESERASDNNGLERGSRNVNKEHCDTVEEVNEILHSRDFNKRTVDGRSRLKYLEQKLKDAGITDIRNECNKETREPPREDAQVGDQLVTYDKNENEIKSVINNTDEDCVTEDLLPEFAGSCCEFDVRQVGSFAGFDADDYYVVYDELDDSSSEEEHDHCSVINRCAMRGDGTMGTDGDRIKQHNPDHDNLRSLLKKPGRGKDGKKNKVIFNENKNEFFDADYIILIREECDYDEEEDDGVCCCNQHEMVRLTCCEPNCNCNFDGYSDQTPQSPKFAPPLEFVDAVTLSPPEGYKDMELGEQQLLALQQMSRRSQRTAVCRECSATHEDEDDGSLSDNEERCQVNDGEKEKTDQSQQTTPTTPPPEVDSNGRKYNVEAMTMTTATKEQRAHREPLDEDKKPAPGGGSPIAGILKGGRLWKQQSVDTNCGKSLEPLPVAETSDEEGSNKRSVRFIESNDDKRDVCDGAADDAVEEICRPNEQRKATGNNCNNSASPESTEMMLTFKLGNHVLISNNSLKPNSAVRQLFPCTKPLPTKPGEEESAHQYLVTAESLRAFEEAKRAKLPQIIQSGDTDESIKRAIERNTLRRSLIRYEPKSKKNAQKADNSLVERIKQLTCDVDDINQEEERTSPSGEEARNSPDINHAVNKNHDKSFSPSSSSTASSSSSSVSSTYRKITDLFAKKDKPDIQNNVLPTEHRQLAHSHPDLGNGGGLHPQEFAEPHYSFNKGVPSNESRKQFLSSLACVSGVGTAGEYYYPMGANPGDRMSVASSVGNEYSLEDIDEGLKNDEEESKRIAPDVLAGTPSASESGDELAMFVQQDAGRIERIKKKYQQDTNNEEEDEHDDYGFNRRPSVRGIKPKFGTTTEILQQIQNQLQPPAVAAVARPNNHVAWPYYSESGLSGFDNAKRNINQTAYQHPNIGAEDLKSRNFVPPQFRPVGLVEESIYQNCSNQRCNREVVYRANVNHVYAPVVRVGGGCTDYYQSLPRNRNGRPLSPPPLDVSKTFHQTMVYIPYNHLEGYQPTTITPNTYYAPTNDPCYARVSNQNQINKRYIDPIYATQHLEEQRYQTNVPLPPKQLLRVSYTTQQAHIINSRSESPLPGQFSTARSTQTPSATLSTCSYYPTAPRYRSMVGPPWQTEGLYANKVNRHSFPAAAPRYAHPPEHDNDSQHGIPNGLRHTLDMAFSKDSMPNSPTKPRYIERGAPEGAASISPQDASPGVQSSGTMTSPTSPQQNAPKTMFYAMNV